MIVIGDIHGEIQQLRKILNLIKDEGDIFVFIGDYIGGGDCSKEVLSELCNFGKKHKCIFIKGNHDEAFLRFIESKNFGGYIRRYGKSVLNSYIPEIPRNKEIDELIDEYIDPSHISFLKKLVPSYNTECFKFSHTGNQYNFSKKQNDIQRLSIYGHFPQEKGIPYLKDNTLCVDTGCGYNGPLTAVNLFNLSYLQVDKQLNHKRGYLVQA